MKISKTSNFIVVYILKNGYFMKGIIIIGRADIAEYRINKKYLAPKIKASEKRGVTT